MTVKNPRLRHWPHGEEYDDQLQIQALHRHRAVNDQVAYEETTGATRISRRLVRLLPNATGHELLAEQRAWDLAHSSDPSAVPQGPTGGSPKNMPRFVLIGLGFVGVAALIWLLRQLSWLIAPVFLALNLVIAVYPVQTFLRRRRCPRWLAVLVTAFVLLAVVAILGLSMVWAGATVVAQIPDYANRFATLYENSYQWLLDQGLNQATLDEIMSGFHPSNLLGALGQVLSSFSGIISLVAVLLSTLIMMMIDVGGWSERIAVAGSSHPRIVAAMRMFANGIRRYWVVSAGFGAVMAALNYIELMIVGAPLPFVWALLTFFTTFIPSVGFFFAMVPPVLATLVMNGSEDALLLMIMYFITTWIVQGVFQPMMTGDAVGVNPTISLISLLFWAWVFGPLGALIALPCTLLFKAMVIDADPKVRWVNSLIANKADVKGASAQS